MFEDLFLLTTCSCFVNSELVRLPKITLEEIYSNGEIVTVVNAGNTLLVKVVPLVRVF